MKTYFIVFGMIAFYALIITVLDRMGSRRQRRSAGKS
jgi:preprotein translocase subunit SecE